MSSYESSIECLYSMPTFDVPTQRFISRFIEVVLDKNLASIKRLVIHNWIDRWRHREMCGFHGVARDEDGSPEWVKARKGIAEKVVGLKWCTLVVHISGGGTEFPWSDPTAINFQHQTAIAFQLISALKQMDHGNVRCSFHLIPAMEQTDQGNAIKCHLVAAAEAPRRSPNAAGHWLSKKDAEERVPISCGRNPVPKLPDNWATADWIPIETRQSILTKEEEAKLVFPY